jgi:nucleoside 2-deoxyribosyltransferase
MKKRLIYLAGPINGCTDEECKDWREYVKSQLGEESTLDPMRRDYRGREMECVDEIVEGDKVDIDQSDILLINYDRPSVGTSMEILYAWERGKKIIVVAPPTAGFRISPWLKYHSHRIFFSFENALTYIGRDSE